MSQNVWKLVPETEAKMFKNSTLVPRKMKGALSHRKVPFMFWKNNTLKK